VKTAEGVATGIVMPAGAEVTELALQLPSEQFEALEEEAYRLQLTVGQLIRRTVNDFLLKPVAFEGSPFPRLASVERQETSPC
jgi:hypothetical protein